MITKARRLLRVGLRSGFGSSGEKPAQERGSGGEVAEVEAGKVELMEDRYEKTRMAGLQERELSGLDAFQREILAQNKFDLLDPRIKPKVASLSTTMGLEVGEGQGLTEVSLGKVKVKQENEVFLSEVDPSRIPEYHNVVFDFEKRMSLVGRPDDSGSQSGEAASEMSVSARRAFEERSQEEIAREVFGFGFASELSFRREVKRWLVSMFVGLVFMAPIVATFTEIMQCQESIQLIEEERMQHLQKFKRQALARAIISNPDMKI